MICLCNTQVTDVGAQALANACPDLTRIGLENTQVIDVVAQALANACHNLAWISLGGTQVTYAGKQQMRAKLPNLTVYVSVESGRVGGGLGSYSNFTSVPQLTCSIFKNN